ncbi:MAG TPA: cysteine desulfurase-like protein [Longimicrobiaceae bacterium]|nr:cysteine desulfurase-like protein [Longimicrobiaceae bacterium]
MENFAERVRRDFPVFEREIAGKPIAFFDGPAGSQVPRLVARAMYDYLTLHNANTVGQFATSQETDEIIAGARRAMADFVGGAADEMVFGANMTTLTFHLSRSLGRAFAPGDEVIVTQLDHQANVAPWRRMAEDVGMEVRVVPFDPETLQLDYAALEAAIGPRTRLVAIGAASNAVGTINDVRRVADLAHAARALAFVDAVHYAPHHRIDVAALGADFLVCSTYKFFGPHAGVLWGRRELLERFTPYKVPPASDAPPDRWETGTQSHEAMAATAAAVDWIASLGGEGPGGRRGALDRAFEAMHAHESRLFRCLEDGLRQIEGVRFFGAARGRPRTPTAAFVVDGVTPQEVARRLGTEGVFVWNGDFYATTVCDTLGLSGCGGLVRAGVAPYTTDDDVRRLIDGVARIAAGR